MVVKGEGVEEWGAHVEGVEVLVSVAGDEAVEVVEGVEGLVATEETVNVGVAVVVGGEDGVLNSGPTVIDFAPLAVPNKERVATPDCEGVDVGLPE